MPWPHDVVEPRRKLRGLSRALCLLLALMGAVGAAPSRAAADDGGYTLGPEDKIRLKVFEWRASQDQVFEWKALNDEFIVSAAGTLSIPFIGEVQAQGNAPSVVAQMIATTLQRRMGMQAPPDASVDVIQYRPFFVSGDVARPGPYPYHPGLTVLEAVATAGGALHRIDRASAREVIAGKGELAQVAHDMVALIVRRARLQAEIDGSGTIKLPAELGGPSAEGVAAALQAETLILSSHQTAFAAQTAALKELKVFLGKEVDSITAQLATVDTQMQSINKELTNVASLVDKGMAVAPRQMSLERSVAQITGERLGMQTNKLRVQEEISKTDIAILQLRNSRTTDAAIEMRDTDVRLVELRNKADVSSKLLYDAQLTAPVLLGDRLHPKAVQPIYRMVRPGVPGPAPQVEETARMDPGDTIKVELPLAPSMAESADATAVDGQSPAQ